MSLLPLDRHNQLANFLTCATKTIQVALVLISNMIKHSIQKMYSPGSTQDHSDRQGPQHQLNMFFTSSIPFNPIVVRIPQPEHLDISTLYQKDSAK